MKKLFISGLALLAGIGFLCSVTAAGTQTYIVSNRWFIADFGTYEARVGKYGAPITLTVEGKQLIQSSRLLNHDIRVVQGASSHEKGNFPPVRITRKDDKLIFEREGILGNEQYPELEKYKQVMTMDTSGKITVHYEVEFLVDITYKGRGYVMNLSSIPMDEVKGKGFMIKGANGRESIGVIPSEYSTETAARLHGGKEAKLVTSHGVLILRAGENSVVRVSDTRSYGGNIIRPDITTDDPWSPLPKKIPKGSRHELNFTIELPVKGEGILPMLPVAKVKD